MNRSEPFMTFNPDAGPVAIVGVLLFALFGLACALRPRSVVRAVGAMANRFGPPHLREDVDRESGTARLIGLRLFGALMALLGFYFFVGLLTALPIAGGAS